MDVREAGVAVGAALGTWLVLVTAAGIVAGASGPMRLISVVIAAVLVFPLRVVVRAVRGGDLVAGLVDAARGQRWALGLTAVLAVGAAVSLRVDAGPLYLLSLPYTRLSPIIFRASLFYERAVGAWLGGIVFVAGRWYITVLWLYLVSVTVATVTHKGLRWWR